MDPSRLSRPGYRFSRLSESDWRYLSAILRDWLRWHIHGAEPGRDARRFDVMVGVELRKIDHAGNTKITARPSATRSPAVRGTTS